MHDVERLTWNILRNAMLTLDPNRESWFVDAGAGDADYYFEWAANFGYKTLVIEPLPNDQVKTICAGRNIPLVEKAIAAGKGQVCLQTTRGNLHSIYPYWGQAQQETLVDCATLSSIIINSPIDSAVNFLKLDIEGAEVDAIRDLNYHILKPLVVVFEFGGHGTYGSGQGGWCQEALFNTWRCITTLDELGYRMVMVVENHMTGSTSVNWESIFTPGDTWGNIIAFLDPNAYNMAFEWANSELEYHP